VDGRFREALESQKKDNTSLLHLVHSEDLKYVDIFGRFSMFSFKALLFKFLSLAAKAWPLEWYLILQSRKSADDSTVRCSWIHGPSHIASLFVGLDDRSVTSSLTISTIILQVPSQRQRRETVKRKNEPLLLCIDNDRCWCGDPHSLINGATESWKVWHWQIWRNDSLLQSYHAIDRKTIMNKIGIEKPNICIMWILFIWIGKMLSLCTPGACRSAAEVPCVSTHQESKQLGCIWVRPVWGRGWITYQIEARMKFPRPSHAANKPILVDCSAKRDAPDWPDIHLSHTAHLHISLALAFPEWPLGVAVVNRVLSAAVRLTESRVWETSKERSQMWAFIEISSKSAGLAWEKFEHMPRGKNISISGSEYGVRSGGFIAQMLKNCFGMDDISSMRWSLFKKFIQIDFPITGIGTSAIRSWEPDLSGATLKMQIRTWPD
jgi:hypothetical protein